MKVTFRDMLRGAQLIDDVQVPLDCHYPERRDSFGRPVDVYTSTLAVEVGGEEVRAVLFTDAGLASFATWDVSRATEQELRTQIMLAISERIFGAPL